MNCDQVFDILTRGPFPTGTSCDEPVEMHLSQCVECHRLAEALRPAVELFQEAVDPEESRDLPGYWCAATAEGLQPAVSYAQEVEPRAPAPRGRTHRLPSGPWSALAAWRLAAMLAVGVTLGTLASVRWAPDGIHWPGDSGKTATVAPAAADEHARFTTAELAALPAACSRLAPAAKPGPRYSITSDSLLSAVDLASFSCCSGCHNAASDAVTSAATFRVAQSCQLCHAEPTSHVESFP